MWQKRAIAVVWIMLLLAMGSPSAAQGDYTGALEPAQGLVQHQPAGAEMWETVTRRALVGEGDWVRTDPVGLAYLRFFDGVESEVLPDSVVQVRELGYDADDDSFQLTVDVLAGDALNRLERTLDARSRYRIYTPGASLTVRGTAFWVSVTTEGETQINTLEGEVLAVSGRVEPEALDEISAAYWADEPLPVPPDRVRPVAAGLSMVVDPDGGFGAVVPVDELPEYPARVPLVPTTCGNGVCDANEDETSCPLDCLTVATCGNGRCEPRSGENRVTCPPDCIFALPGDDELGDPDGDEFVYMHFFWAERRCDLDPPGQPVARPLMMHWGVGCFDSAPHASAHVYPADYQLFVDGQAWDMSTLRQSGPNQHSPYCPWGWNFTMGPVTLDPGNHRLQLVETITDTWSGQSGGRNAGQVVTLDCQISIAGP
jgi:hypothetical protein